MNRYTLQSNVGIDCMKNRCDQANRYDKVNHQNETEVMILMTEPTALVFILFS